LRHWAAGAAHELGTPLGTIAIVAKELERYAETLSSDDAILEDARLIRSEVERCRLILERMSVAEQRAGWRNGTQDPGPGSLETSSEAGFRIAASLHCRRTFLKTR